jgi:hypothetical protein
MLSRLKNIPTKYIQKELYYRSNGPYTYRIFHPTATEYTFCSSAQRTFPKKDNILGH